MEILKQTAEQQAKIDEFIAEATEKTTTLESYSNYADISELKKIISNFKKKTDNFKRSDRKLNIGVIGQVKAGKSTFLNTLLFNGNDVLPSARTPKTAVLTKMEYSEENTITVEYYEREEWEILEKYAKEDVIDNEHTVAKETINMANQNGINPNELIIKKSDKIVFESIDSLMGQLNEYVGENGKYTPLVKIVTISMDMPELMDISIVDTPGLNDAIASRTDKTRQFIEECDVVFFLSRASQFLASEDMKLLTAQLPSKGVDDITLICSQFDMGIFDDLMKTKSISVSIENVRKNLSQHANSIIDNALKNMNESNINMSKKSALEKCRNPIFISSIIYNMATKNEADYNSNEKYVFKRLSKYGELTSDEFNKIGNIDTVKQKFNIVVQNKDETLKNKAQKFIPNVKNEWNTTVNNVIYDVNSKLQILESGDKESIKKQKALVESQIDAIKASLETVLGELLISLENTKTDCMRKLRENCRDSAKIDERQGTEWHTSSHIVGQKSFLCFKWGGHSETTSYSTTYSYLAASDALENVRNFALDACSDIEESFTKAVNVKSTKRNLLDTILNNFDTSDENFDINHFRHITESTLNQLEFPIVKIDSSPFIEKISSKFSGEIKSSSERSELLKLLTSAIDTLYDNISAIFIDKISKFKIDINEIKTSFGDILLKNINDDYSKLEEHFKNKEEEIEKYKKCLDMLKLISNF